MYSVTDVSFIVVCIVGKIKSLGSTELLSSAQAREQAMAILVAAKDGQEIGSRKTRVNVPTLQDFVFGQYGAWRVANRKAGKQDIAKIKSVFFNDFADYDLDKILPLDLENWRIERLQAGIKPVTLLIEILFC
ncbi:MAG: hypothetical protein JXR42_00240 [Gammaproteobacteria bacterium]|nr:hypothetical protein [Gammaproteobacteria bacterium]